MFVKHYNTKFTLILAPNINKAPLKRKKNGGVIAPLQTAMEALKGHNGGDGKYKNKIDSSDLLKICIYMAHFILSA